MKFATLALILIMALAACGGAPSAPVLPTSALDVVTLSPTPMAEGVAATPLPPERPTLPPTWTPESTLSPTPRVAPPIQMVSATPAVCAAFIVDAVRSTRSFMVGEAPSVTWSPIEGVSRYRVRLFDATLTTLLVDYTQQPQFTFDATLFSSGVRYGWEVLPENAAFQQLCFAIGDDLQPF
jgi:hypothetical protein